jgi:hypothetical protein
MKWAPNNIQPLAIISHQRSGSTWICDSINHYKSYDEFFNPNINLILDHNLNIITKEFNAHVKFKEKIIEERINWYYNILKIPKLHVIKLQANQHMYYNNDIYNIIKNYQIVFLKRKSFYDIFWSFLISRHFNSWDSITDKQKLSNSISITYDEIVYTDQFINSFEDNFCTMQDKLEIQNPEIIYYEDLVSSNISWITKDSKYVIQNNKHKLIIENKEEIILWCYKLFDKNKSIGLINSLNISN